MGTRPSTLGAGLVLPRFLQLGIFRPSPRWVNVWLVGELLAFFLIVDLYGWGGAIFAQIVSTVVGLIMLRRLGGAVSNTITSASRGSAVSGNSLADGVISGIAAVLLILPGYLSSLIAVVLGVTPVRNWVLEQFSKKIGIAGASAPPAGALDLDPSQWRQMPVKADANRDRLP